MQLSRPADGISPIYSRIIVVVLGGGVCIDFRDLLRYFLLMSSESLTTGEDVDQTDPTVGLIR